MRIFFSGVLLFSLIVCSYGQKQPLMIEVDTKDQGFKALSSFKNLFDKKQKLEELPGLAAFSISKTEITVGQFRSYCEALGLQMPKQPDYYRNDNYPVTNVTVFDALGYCTWLSEQGQGTYRLPTFQEWIFAFYGPKQKENIPYSGSKNINDVAWYSSNSKNQIREVATKSANDLDLHDMSGNLSEICLMPSKGNAPEFVKVGGNYASSSEECKAQDPIYIGIDKTLSNVGFRVVWSTN